MGSRALTFGRYNLHPLPAPLLQPKNVRSIANCQDGYVLRFWVGAKLTQQQKGDFIGL